MFQDLKYCITSKAYCLIGNKRVRELIGKGLLCFTIKE
jgi:hypothetical protein